MEGDRVGDSELGREAEEVIVAGFSGVSMHIKMDDPASGVRHNNA